MTLSITTHSPDETKALGRKLGERLSAGSVVALIGQLGAGKTYFTKGIAQGLGVADDRGVTSPTFVLINEYRGRLPIYHFDAYRLSTREEMYDLGCEELFYGDGVCIIEWADRVEECLPEKYLRVEISIVADEVRFFKITGVNDAEMDIASVLEFT